MHLIGVSRGRDSCCRSRKPGLVDNESSPKESEGQVYNTALPECSISILCFLITIHLFGFISFPTSHAPPGFSTSPPSNSRRLHILTLHTPGTRLTTPSPFSVHPSSPACKPKPSFPNLRDDYYRERYFSGIYSPPYAKMEHN